MPVYDLNYPEFLAIMSEELEISKYQKKFLKQCEDFFNFYGAGPGLRDPTRGGIRVELCEYGKNQRNSYWITFDCIPRPTANDIINNDIINNRMYVKTLWCKRKDFPDRHFIEGEQLHRDLAPFERNRVRIA